MVAQNVLLRLLQRYCAVREHHLVAGLVHHRHIRHKAWLTGQCTGYVHREDTLQIPLTPRRNAGIVEQRQGQTTRRTHPFNQLKAVQRERLQLLLIDLLTQGLVEFDRLDDLLNRRFPAS